jgi:hypothetical protein
MVLVVIGGASPAGLSQSGHLIPVMFSLSVQFFNGGPIVLMSVSGWILVVEKSP